MEEAKSPGWMRLVQIGLGVIVLILSIYALAFPAAAIVSLVFIIGIILFVVGIERIVTGIFVPSPGKSRWSTVGLGILVIIVASLAMAFPIAFSAFLIILLALALLFDGIARVIHGIGDKSSGKGSRIFSIVAGVIAIGLSIAIMASPLFGAVLVGVLIAIALLIIGIQIIYAGATGTRFAVRGLR